jgi:hypothetical protein
MTKYEKHGIKTSYKSKYSIGRCLSCGSKSKHKNIYCRKCRRRIYVNSHNYKKGYYSKDNRHTKCVVCGSEENIAPFIGLCLKHKKEAANKYRREWRREVAEKMKLPYYQNEKKEREDKKRKEGAD